MKFAKTVFWIAGAWGLLVLLPLYFMSDVIGRTDPPAITHLGYYFGFLNVTLAWQLAFFILASDPIRFRPMIIAAIAEKVLFFASLIVLCSFGLASKAECVAASPDLILAALFTVAFAKTRSLKSPQSPLARSSN